MPKYMESAPALMAAANDSREPTGAMISKSFLVMVWGFVCKDTPFSRYMGFLCCFIFLVAINCRVVMVLLIVFLFFGVVRIGLLSPHVYKGMRPTRLCTSYFVGQSILSLPLLYDIYAIVYANGQRLQASLCPLALYRNNCF